MFFHKRFSKHQEHFFLSLIFIVGLAVRLFAPLASAFPLNDGGLFYQMVLDVQANGYRLPAFTSYNGGEIPFAYPPLAFYFYALLQRVTGLALLDLMRVLPALFSGLTVPVFYLLARELAPDSGQALWATAVFALLPRTFDWLIMGGGLTRAPGLLFSLLTLWQTWRLFTQPAPNKAMTLGLLLALTALTHPEGLAQAIVHGAFFFLWKNRTLKGVLHGLAAIGLGALLSSPWWLTVLLRHGLHPFLAALSAARADGLAFPLRLAGLLKFEFTDERLLPVFAVLGLIGLVRFLATQRDALLLWFIGIYLFEPRSGTLYMMIALALAVAAALQEMLRPALATSRLAWTLLAGLILLYGTLNALNIAAHIERNLTLRPASLETFAWIRTHTPESSRFVLLTGAHPLNDSFSEWFPALTGRISLLTVFGAEWQNDGRFAKRLNGYRAAQACLSQDEACLNQTLSDVEWSHVYIQKPSLLAERLKQSPRFRLLRETETGVLLQREADE